MIYSVFARAHGGHRARVAVPGHGVHGDRRTRAGAADAAPNVLDGRVRRRR